MILDSVLPHMMGASAEATDGLTRGHGCLSGDGTVDNNTSATFFTFFSGHLQGYPASQHMTFGDLSGRV